MKLVLALYGCFVVLCALFGLSVLHLPSAEVSNWADSEGNLYTGSLSMIDDSFDGRLTIVFASGDNYAGELSANGFEGQATYTSTAGWSIAGNFNNGYLEGYGTYTDARGKYEGQFVQSIPQGQGSYTSALGWVYAGEFLQGAITGSGELRLKDGTVYTGIWQDGRLSTQ
jgi:hypothetical protein